MIGLKQLHHVAGIDCGKEHSRLGHSIGRILAHGSLNRLVKHLGKLQVARMGSCLSFSLHHVQPHNEVTRTMVNAKRCAIPPRSASVNLGFYSVDRERHLSALNSCTL